MKIEDAIRNVTYIFMNFPDITSDEDIESFEIAVEAMKKQDPMKPNIYPSGKFYIFECNKCGVTISGIDKYCHECGQKIDWGD